MNELKTSLRNLASKTLDFVEKTPHWKLLIVGVLAGVILKSACGILS